MWTTTSGCQLAPGGVTFLLFCVWAFFDKMPIYESHRAVIGTLPELCLKPVPSLNEIIDDMVGQFGLATLKTLVCNDMQHSAKSFVIHLCKKEQVAEFIANGISFRKHPVKLEEAKGTTTINLERVPYGLPVDSIVAALRPYGEVKPPRSIKYKGFGVSKLSVEVKLKSDIPSQIRIQGNPVNVFYRGQPRSCFVCNGSGHEAKACPRKRQPAGAQPVTAPRASAPNSTESRAGKRPQVSNSDDELSFADIVCSGGSISTPPSPPEDVVIPPEEVIESAWIDPPATTDELVMSQSADAVSPPLPENVPLPAATEESEAIELPGKTWDHLFDPGSQDLSQGDSPTATSPVTNVVEADAQKSTTELLSPDIALLRRLCNEEPEKDLVPRPLPPSYRSSLDTVLLEMAGRRTGHRATARQPPPKQVLTSALKRSC